MTLFPNIPTIRYSSTRFEATSFSGDRFFAIVGSIGSLANALSRVFWGRLSDHFGPLPILLVLAIASPIAMTFYTLSTISGSNNGFSIGVISIYFAYGGNFSVYPSLIASLFGPKRVGINYGFCHLFVGSVSSTLIIVMGKSNVDCNYLNYGVIGAGIMGIIPVFFLGRRAGKQLDDNKWGGGLGTKYL